MIFILISACAAPRLDLSLDFHTSQDNSIKQRGLALFTDGAEQSRKIGTVPGVQGILGVDEFIDLRPQVVTSDARKWIGFIPGVLWIEFISEIPDTYTVFSDYKSSSFTIAVAKAIYTDVEREGFFEKTLFLPEDKYAKIDYRLEGVLNRTFLKETGYYYGSGLYAWVTRIIGLPYVSYEFSIDVTLRLRRMDTDEIVWTHELEGSRSDKFNSVYKLTAGKEGKHILSYNISKILEKEMPVVLESMRNALGNL